MTTRRELLKKSLVVLAALPLGACGGGGDDCVCNVPTGLSPADQAMRSGQSYVDHSTHSDRHCSNCRFFTPGAAGECGTCQLVHGTIHPDGYCNLWSAAS